MNTDTLVIFLISQNMFYYFWMITWMKKVLLSICLFFCQIQPGVAYESAAYKAIFYKNHL